jgi:hypothetical protein
MLSLGLLYRQKIASKHNVRHCYFFFLENARGLCFISLKKLGRGGNDRFPGIILKRDRNIGPAQENPRTLPPITNGSASTVYSATT